ncbi:MAG: pseudouridine-5'-phosphate glycosidase [Pyrinomonadaceae bacterium]|nr:pseudouridine-5'-phosphate glycosidase [Pyrinomonadaceae bacterium]
MKIQYNSEVTDALKQDLPIVALESTVISHGLPYPLNIKTAKRMEDTVREHGAVPATIAVLGGIPTVGLTEDQLALLAGSENTRKISTRDLPVVIGKEVNCATTVATTMFFAWKAGIDVFATGGIGGVHRGDGSDVSADLPAIAGIPITTVCAGAKSVLDLSATREWLETNGVCVVGWRTSEFPAFYSESSGLEVDEKVDSATEVARIINARDRLGLDSCVLLTVPVPESDSIEAAEIDDWLSRALQEASERGIKGKETTPFLLSRLVEFSDGKTLDANIALLINNAGVAAKVAVELNRK